MHTHLGHCPSCLGVHDRIAIFRASDESDVFLADCPVTNQCLVIEPGQPTKLFFEPVPDADTDLGTAPIQFPTHAEYDDDPR